MRQVKELVFESDSEEHFTSDDSENESTKDLSEDTDHGITENEEE